MKAVLVDDEQLAIEELIYMFERFSNLEIVATFTKSKQALEYVILNQVDIIFLDIAMPEMDGFMLAEAILRLRMPPYIIFVTAFDEYAIKAFEINAVDYLLKPLTEERVELTMKKIEELLPRTNTIESVKKVLNTRYVEKKATRIPLWRDDRIHLVNPESIAYIETKDGETIIYANKGAFITTDKLCHYEEILCGYGFYRCHRSFLIRIDAIREVIPWFNNTYQVKLNGYESVQIPVSRRNVKEFKDHLSL